MPRTPKTLRKAARRRRSAGESPRKALAWFDLPEGATAKREEALASIRRAGLRFGIRIVPIDDTGETKAAPRNTLLD